MSDEPQVPEIPVTPPPAVPAAPTAPPSTPPEVEAEASAGDDSYMGARIDRLSGEPAPDISPEEFARLQRGSSGLNFDARGRVRISRDTEDDPGVSLRKRRAWYAC